MTVTLFHSIKLAQAYSKQLFLWDFNKSSLSLNPIGHFEKFSIEIPSQMVNPTYALN